MIRPYSQLDRDAVVQMVQAGVSLTAAEIDVKLKAQTVLVYDDGQVKGCATFSAANQEHHAQGELSLCVHPDQRG